MLLSSGSRLFFHFGDSNSIHGDCGNLAYSGLYWLAIELRSCTKCFYLSVRVEGGDGGVVVLGQDTNRNRKQRLGGSTCEQQPDQRRISIAFSFAVCSGGDT